MFELARKRLTYANVAATLALVFSMTGGALAAKHYLINSTGQINPKVLKKLKAELAPRPTKAFNATSVSDLFNFPSIANETATVYSLRLPAGKFSVLGKLIANNDDTTPGHAAEVRCELFLGQTAIDTGFSGVTLSQYPNDRKYMVLAGTGSLSRPDSARIVCKTSGTEGEYMDRSITAVQVGSLG
jgi:hypothetical protein